MRRRITNLDHHHKETSGEYSGTRVISSRILVDEFGGQEAIMKALHTNPEVSSLATDVFQTGIPGSEADIRDRERM